MEIVRSHSIFADMYALADDGLGVEDIVVILNLHPDVVRRHVWRHMSTVRWAATEMQRNPSWGRR